MKKTTRSTIEVQGTSISILSQPGGDYISLTDMVRNFDGEDALIEQWLKNKDTVLFLGVWERINNPDFNSLEFEGIRNEAGRNSFFLSAKKWIEQTGAKGLIASVGRYGGTYAHKDIAFEFGSWLSPEFKLYLIKEFQRLKDEENDQLKLGYRKSLNRSSPAANPSGMTYLYQRRPSNVGSSVRSDLFPNSPSLRKRDGPKVCRMSTTRQRSCCATPRKGSTKPAAR